MTETLDLFGGSAPVGPPAVLPVIFHGKPHRERIATVRKPVCGHCAMVVDLHARLTRTGEQLPEKWRDFVNNARVTVLRAVYRITQTDGSTLDLCGQHAQEHEQRGDSDE